MGKYEDLANLEPLFWVQWRYADDESADWHTIFIANDITRGRAIMNEAMVMYAAKFPERLIFRVTTDPFWVPAGPALTAWISEGHTND
jgi:hypothetical protein